MQTCKLRKVGTHETMTANVEYGDGDDPWCGDCFFYDGQEWIVVKIYS